MRTNIKIILFALIFGISFYLFQSFGLGQHLTLEALKSQQSNLQMFYASNPTQMIIGYMLVYIFVTALSLPGAVIMTLAGGAVFGLFAGTIIVSFASTIGATCAFLVSRFLLRDSIQNRFSDKIAGFNDGIKKEGAFYLFTLRLVPIFPFFLINLAMGVTPLRTSIFFIVSQIGMLPGTAAFVNAGTELSQITSLQGILSPGLLLSFAIIGLMPLISKSLIGLLKARKVYSRFKKPATFDYNLIAIGGGAAGLVSTYIGAAVKAKVALIEKHKMGGDCLNTGCVPSKALIKSAKILNNIKRSKEFGIQSASSQYEFSDIMERVQRVIKKIEPHDSIERYSKLGVDCLAGTAKIKSPWEIEVNGKILTTKNIVIATGARPFIPSIPGLEKIKYYTSDDIWELRDMPKRMIVLGGGAIGSELAQAFARIGCQVTQVERGPRIMGREDTDVSELIMEQFKNEGIDLHVNTEVKEITVDQGKQHLVCSTPSGTRHLEFDALLLAVGRAANVKGFGLEELGIDISARGSVVVDEYLRTKYPNIYACGDVAGPYQFTHTASHMAWYCAVNALFGQFKKFKVDYRVIPWATFTDPEVARVGINELEAKEKGIDYELYKYELSDLDRAIADEEDRGFVKVLLQPGTDKILGVTIAGPHAAEIIIEYVTAMKHNLGLNKILGTIHIYPTFSEANKYAAGVWKRETKPVKLLSLVSKLHTFTRR